MEFVVPTLNMGLLEVSNIIPNDPVDLLAEFLYQKSYDVWSILVLIPSLRFWLKLHLVAKESSPIKEEPLA